ncbi:MAG: tetratricopeptide repeat protein [Candidatus Omnitrophica bacterium]|nr:tetratricopeptide repeat protein [Candidatus Omnitrophota bacterium]
MFKKTIINIFLIVIFMAAMTAVTLPFSARVKVNTARKLTRSGMLEEAERAYEEALVLAPMSSDYWVEYGDFLWDISVETDSDRLWEKTGPAYRRATQLNPNRARCWVNRGHVAFADGEIDKAIGHFRHAKTLDPNGGDTAFYLRKAGLKLLEEDAGYYDVVVELTGETQLKP